jgi:hypothetical protein
MGINNTMRLKITVGFAALALATAFASAPAFAAQGIPGYSSDGSVVGIHHHRHQTGARPLYNSAPQHEHRHDPSYRAGYYNYSPGYGGGGSSGGPYNYSGYVSGQPGPIREPNRNANFWWPLTRQKPNRSFVPGRALARHVKPGRTASARTETRPDRSMRS